MYIAIMRRPHSAAYNKSMSPQDGLACVSSVSFCLCVEAVCLCLFMCVRLCLHCVRAHVCVCVCVCVLFRNVYD